MKLNASLPRGFKVHLPPGAKDRMNRQIGVQDKKSKPRT
jgi:hypothetical protein